MNNTAVTTRIALDWFEYDPYGYKPDWWRQLVITGKAFEHKEYASFNTEHATFHPKVGHRIYLTQDEELGSWTPEQFKVRCRMIDPEKDAAPMFIERSKDGIHKFMEKLRKMRK